MKNNGFMSCFQTAFSLVTFRINSGALYCHNVYTFYAVKKNIVTPVLGQISGAVFSTVSGFR